MKRTTAGTLWRSTAEREIRAIEEASDQFPGVTRRLLTLTQDLAPAQAPAGVVVQPAYAWMLEAPAEC